ncbi:hypothetical protein BIY27_25865 [Gibbsiella quercinecans]|uniref:putative urea ABC transporter substrate-binding protein n=1 Tax=Gibbsiella quercinecans TaxID=929813 RepID=UPI000EF18E95|nr:putative urea ABC transporter substrate-binding protein [Gibbsiella quercinecans]RLM02090.1 hypothetical protein BIY27_25865 [Gibbsiella quercinecans]
MKRLFSANGLFAVFLFCFSLHAIADKPPQVRIAWSVYVGSMPLGYAQESGILKRWGEKFGVDLSAVQVNDYIEGINQYTAGEFEGTIAMLLDALTIPAASGVDTSVPLLLSNSLGNDGIILKGGKDLSAIKGQPVNLVQFSGSHYLLARGLEKAGLSERDVTVVNTSDADMIALFPNNTVKAMVTWQPQLASILSANTNAHLVFSSADIPGEINDGLLIRTDLLKKHPGIGKAIAGAWYEVMDILAASGPEHEQAIAWMAEASGTDAAGFRQQLKTTHFYAPAEGAAFVGSADFQQGLAHIQQFSFEQGLLGEGIRQPGDIGIAFPGKVAGNAKHIKLRFPAEFMGK